VADEVEQAERTEVVELTGAANESKQSK